MNRHARLAAAVTAAAVIACAAAMEARAEVVFLRDGRIVEGKVLNETPAAVTVRKRDGSLAEFGRGAVLRILYTDVYMGKVYIHKTDGKMVEAYVVDEDRDSYTVRTDLNSPKEMVIKRQDVLFMVRKNPSALKEKVAQRHVDLSWLAPFNPVKHYRVYIRQRGGEYRLDGTSFFVKYRATGLSCNTAYSAYVTAVDRDNYESLLSNEVQFTTLKGEPLPPGGVAMKVDRKDKKKPLNARITWDRAQDPCGGAI
ncbi:MAG TPA: fibronectin type III domain-containing protein, partial [Spirochaetota bacterium]|nr:fibronectin type III domain-containing protein [Spirochaetota bacterium]